MFSYYMRRIVKSKIYLICIGISVGVLIIGCLQQLMLAQTLTEKGMISLMECLHTTLDAGGIFAVIVPALVPASFLFFYTEELEKKVVYYQLLRTSRKKYYRSQIMSALISAFLMIGISLVIFCAICLIVGVVWDNAGWFVIFDETNIAHYFEENSIWKMTIWYLILTILYSLEWPIIGILVSLITKNRYVILAAPFVIFMAWNYMTQLIYGIFHNVLWIMPVQPLLLWGLPWEPYWTLTLTILYPIIYHAVLIVGLTGICLIITKRRYLREGL